MRDLPIHPNWSICEAILNIHQKVHLKVFWRTGVVGIADRHQTLEPAKVIMRVEGKATHQVQSLARTRQSMCASRRSSITGRC